MFTNFSHELRNPLTLIIAPLQDLVSMPEFSSSVKNKLSLIFSNAQRLLLLVNQLMDLRKNQEGKLKLHIAKTDMNLFLQEIYYAFNHLAAKKSIEFTFEKNEELSLIHISPFGSWRNVFILIFLNCLSTVIRAISEENVNYWRLFARKPYLCTPTVCLSSRIAVRRKLFLMLPSN